MTEEELLPLAARAMNMAWPQKRVNEHVRIWNPARNDNDCMEVIFTLGLIVEPMGFNSLPELRYSILQRAAYIGLHK